MLTKKNYLFLSFALLMFFQTAEAKDEVTKTENENSHFITGHQIGINIASFADRFLKFNNTTNNLTDPFLFSYRMQLCKNSVIRVGVGGSVQNEELTSSTTSQPRKNVSNTFMFRAGYEYYLLNTSKWKAGAGIDFFTGRIYSQSVQFDAGQNTKFTQTDKTSSNGFGPELSIQYYLSHRVSIGTEGNVYYAKQKQKSTSEVTGQFPESNSSSTTTTLFKPQMPVSLFINFNF